MLRDSAARECDTLTVSCRSTAACLQIVVRYLVAVQGSSEGTDCCSPLIAPSCVSLPPWRWSVFAQDYDSSCYMTEAEAHILGGFRMRPHLSQVIVLAKRPPVSRHTCSRSMQACRRTSPGTVRQNIAQV